MKPGNLVTIQQGRFEGRIGLIEFQIVGSDYFSVLIYDEDNVGNSWPFAPHELEVYATEPEDDPEEWFKFFDEEPHPDTWEVACRKAEQRGDI
jgi:hypothetical protein